MTGRRIPAGGRRHSWRKRENAEGIVEIKRRDTGDSEDIHIDNLTNYVSDLYSNI